MQVSEKTYAKMPPNLQAMFCKLPNPGSEEVRECFPETKSGALSPHHKLKASENNSMSGANQERSPRQEFGNDSGNASRYFKSIIYQAKASKKERGEGNNHPTVKPVALMKYLVRLVTPPSGIVLDPFMGSGSTGIAAIAEEFKFIGIEMDEKSFSIAKKRLEYA